MNIETNENRRIEEWFHMSTNAQRIIYLQYKIIIPGCEI